jgi:nucleotide-binding universal stress UspA family protein
MKHILVPIGSTESAKKTLQYAIDFASEINAKIFVFRAYSVKSKAGTIININSIIERETNLYLRTLVNTVDVKNVAIKLISAKGTVLDSVEAIDQELGVDLIIVGTRSNAIKEEIFLGKTAGSLVKQTEISVLAVPEGYVFIPITTILMAFKSGIVRSKTALNSLHFMVNKFNTKVNLLLVKTPSYIEEDLIIHKDLEKIKSTLTVTENATTFQGVLEHIQSINPDMLCVLRRKKGFFKKLWEKNTVLKKEFSTNVPLLILKGK